MTATLKPDVLLIGGGIAGLWLLNHFQQAGYQCVLLEKGRLGSGQTLASQGIIHGGLKYALNGSLSGESEAIAEMPSRWRNALAGRGSVNLSGLPLLSDTQYLWSAGSMASRMTAFFASKMLRGRIDKLPRSDYPDALNDDAFKGRVYRLEDLVVNTEVLVKHLAAKANGCALQFDPARDHIEWDDSGVAYVDLHGTRIEPDVTICCAGQGNGDLLNQAHKHNLLLQEDMQLRPLKMLAVKQSGLPAFFGHCLGASNKPQLTVTSHPGSDGEQVWYLGGDIAEKGVERTDAEQVAAGQQLLQQLFPWRDWQGARYAPIEINRAEPKLSQLMKPDSAYVKRDRKVLIAWPTKLTLVPDLADKVAALLDPPRQAPMDMPELPQASAGLGRWHSCGWQTP